ncbi:mechanosensitive ion channel family protein [Thiocapsa rosea]|uniref:MscS family membrane protein n=1 Tax=Thiocapsa rosea TaxID=69360 RepID=A0A495VDK1_9GAMM|nr:mechanosensitive ion channel domain-containing protein [Thiocapsa rosea]RKT47344.1 MscS family membrane protein [Thiocapsa rosea]
MNNPFFRTAVSPSASVVRLLLIWMLCWTPGMAFADATGMLGPPDTTSPRATFSGFLALTDTIAERYADYRTAPSAETQRAFLRAVEQGMHLMDLSGVAPAAQHEIATATIIWLWEVIARVELPPVEAIPDAATDTSTVAPADPSPRWHLPGTGIVIQRVEQGERAGAFLFSPETIASARTYAERARELPYLRPSRIEDVQDLTGTALGFSGWMLPPRTIERLPEWARRPIAGQVAWKWGMLLASLASTLALIVVVVRWSRRRAWDARVGTLLRRLVAPLAMLVSMQLLRAFLDDQVQVTGMVTAWPDYLAELASGLALIWTILLFARWIPDALNAMPPSGHKHLDPSLVRWSARVVTLLAILVLLFSAAQDLGIPVYGLVAGAGVGGLAVALAARPTLENFIGALNLFADRPIRVGDLIRFDERHGEGWNPVGRVEAIGLRSTKIRQLDRTLITIPNADLAERNIVNLSACDRFLLQQRFAVRHETGDDQLRYLLAELRELLHAHPKTIHTAEEPIRVRFVGFRDHALTVELRAYIRTTGYSEFLAIQEDIMLRVMKQVTQAGTGFGLPAQVVYMARDAGLDTNARAAAEQQVREWAAAHELPFPDLDETQRKRISDTLDYPPEGSPGADRG